MRDLLGEMAGQEGEPELAAVLDRMGGQTPSLQLPDLPGMVRPLRSPPQTGGPLQPALLSHVLEFLFPDSSVQAARHAYREEEQDSNHSTAVKTGPADCLLWRLAMATACCLQWAGAGGVAHLWHEVCLELRYRWEGGHALPGVPLGPPLHSHALLLQKLQLLNCCTARRLAREAAANTGQSRQTTMVSKENNCPERENQSGRRLI